MSQQTQEKILDLKANYIDKNYEIKYILITNKKVPKNSKELASGITSNYAENINIEFWGIEDLRVQFTEWYGLETTDKISEMINLTGELIELKDPYNCILGQISGRELSRLYRAHKQKLFELNIRQWLGKNKANKGITQSVYESPEEFFYYNNGITAVCEEFESTKDSKGRSSGINTKNFQIINGAQTVKSIADSVDINESVRVLFRLIRVDQSYSSFSNNVIKFQNTQSAVKDYDFRSNDPIQIYLSDNLEQQNPALPTPLFYYARKRSQLPTANSNKKGNKISLDTFARILFSYKYSDFDPRIVYDESKRLWTLEEDDSTSGLYESLFGENSLDKSANWPKSEISEAKIAISINIEIPKIIKELCEEFDEKNYSDIRQYKWWIISMVMRFYKEENIRFNNLLTNKNGYEELKDCIKEAIINIFSNYEAQVLNTNSVKGRDYYRTKSFYTSNKNQFERVLKRSMNK